MARILRGQEWLTQNTESLNQSLSNVVAAEGVPLLVAESATIPAYTQLMIYDANGAYVFSILSSKKGVSVSLISSSGEHFIREICAWKDDTTTKVVIVPLRETSIDIICANVIPSRWFKVSATATEMPAKATSLLLSSSWHGMVIENATINSLQVRTVLETVGAQTIGVDADLFAGGAPSEYVAARAVAPIVANHVSVIIPFDISKSDFSEEIRSAMTLLEDTLLNTSVSFAMRTNNIDAFQSISPVIKSRGFGVIVSLEPDRIPDVAERSLLAQKDYDGIYCESVSSDGEKVTSHWFVYNTLMIRPSLTIIADATALPSLKKVLSNATITVCGDSRVENSLADVIPNIEGHPSAKAVIIRENEPPYITDSIVSVARTIVILPEVGNFHTKVSDSIIDMVRSISRISRGISY